MISDWMRRRRSEREASCMQVARVLQSYLDGEVDDITAQRVRRHLEHCRRCGLKSETYEAIKEAVSRRGHEIDQHTLDRIRDFASHLADEGPAEDTGSPA